MEIPPEESTDLEELEQFAKMFKQKRIKLGKFITLISYVLNLSQNIDDSKKLRKSTNMF